MSIRAENSFPKPKAYAARIKDLSKRDLSQSGGLFAALSDTVLREGGVVYGCAFDESFNAIHMRADTPELRDRMRGSKYIQSSAKDTYRQALNDLKAGREVLYTGTSCQIAGLLSFIGAMRLTDEERSRLYTMDILCHGVPSPLVWQEFLAWEKDGGREIVDVKSRNKEFGWRSSIVTIWFDDGKRTDSRVFPKMFYQNAILRPACYRCPYKDIMHPADITAADYWGIEKALPDFDDRKGTSLVLINNEHGAELFSRSQEGLEIMETDVKVGMQFPLKSPYPRPKNRSRVWKLFYSGDFTRTARRYGNYGLIGRARGKVRSIIKKRKKKLGKA
ncbi:MAG: Coenzyme F420 hydrogenase/dehydrogenase, beta subunit C-terminal domain [Ruminococcus sp.]|nr:Coenzyme F420 hydrogenase/dehydrogenase, beta subunit C-terminal domain [Ruminococcus sp.]